MSRGKRYNGEKKLNVKKVIAFFIFIAIIILAIIGIKQILKADKQTMASKNIELNYFTLFTNGNWGVINSSGETIVEPAYGEMIVIPNKAKPVFICTYEVNYIDGTYKTKAINDKNQQLFTAYENVVAIQNYDKENNLWFEENTLKVQKDGKFGLINLDGKELLPCEYDSISTLKGIKNSLVIKKEGKIGIANANGNTIVPVEYAEINAVTSEYKDGYIVKNAEGKYGVIKSDGNIALECKYDGIKNITNNNMYIAKLQNTWSVTLEDGTTFLSGKVENAVSMESGNVIVNNSNNFGILNIETGEKIPAEYQSLSYMFDDKYIAKKNDKYGIINVNNEVLVDFKYSNISYNKSTDYIKALTENNTYDYMTRDFTVKLNAGEEIILNGFISIKAQDEVKYYNYKLEEKTNKDVFASNTLFIIKNNGKYGFANKDGKVIVEPVYDNAIEQNEYGYSAIKKDGKWGAIDQYGNVVIQPTYELDETKVIDFIGKWHACADANANYYTNVE